ncbi:hypothetical protein K432DRAFT_320115 [Lepidopterella palustris CBS 459.81]|uniref:Uncharacterized protein n=1 Tax=Lepidopterella palustris CBS 459.81 TaxID=1314670 RepID=A0A8E2EIQ9_9PEZI|nr:hypothetical protein K432DRAFT_320115 [Lepidopterella palustris CBS 459.81]
MATNSTIDCSPLSSRTKFKGYINNICSPAGCDFDLVRRCKLQVCNALWGSGNPDISGVGMTIGYISANVLGFAFIATYIYLLRSSTSNKWPRQQKLLSSTLNSFHSAATLLAFSIQIASIVVLVRANFGISADAMGANTVEITWTVSLLTLLPLIYGVFIPEALREPLNPSDQSQYGDTSKANLPFGLFVICYLPSLYPFLSRMISTFGPSQIGNAPGSAISTSDFNTIQTICFAGVTPLSTAEIAAINVFGIAGYLFLSLLTISKIVVLGILKQHPDSKIAASVRSMGLAADNTAMKQSQSIRPVPSLFTLTIAISIPLFSITQLWTFFRMLHLQTQMARATGNVYLDTQWTFGQVVAVTVFAPVLVEGLYGWLHE